MTVFIGTFISLAGNTRRSSRLYQERRIVWVPMRSMPMILSRNFLTSSRSLAAFGISQPDNSAGTCRYNFENGRKSETRRTGIPSGIIIKPIQFRTELMDELYAEITRREWRDNDCQGYWRVRPSQARAWVKTLKAFAHLWRLREASRIYYFHNGGSQSLHWKCDAMVPAWTEGSNRSCRGRRHPKRQARNLKVQSSGQRQRYAMKEDGSMRSKKQTADEPFKSEQEFSHYTGKR